MRRSIAVVGAALLLTAGSAAAQETGMPVYWAPYRAFDQHEIGGTVSFPDGGTGFEGFYGFGAGKLDLGLRGGFWSPGNNAKTRILVGVHGRQRVITQSDDFPIDGAVVLGVGAQLVSDSVENSVLLIPAGLSLGHRFNIENSNVSIVPFVQPSIFLAFNDGTDVLFAFGFGADFRLSKALDARISVGLGDVAGVALGAVWVH